MRNNNKPKKKYRLNKRGKIVITSLAVIAVVLFALIYSGVLIHEPTISFKDSTATVYMGYSSKLTVQTDPSDEALPDMTWASSDKNVATVSSSGKVTPVSKGETTITAKSRKGQKITCSVTVKKPLKTIYLTFDDGPSSNITPKLIKLLKDNNVHATFFIVGYEAKDNEKLVKEEYDNGNCIGIHTYTHDYTQIYASKSAFMSDFNKTKAILKKITGETPTVCRMPGGSNNGYCNAALGRSIVKELRSQGFKVTDWVASYGDSTVKPTKASTLAHRAIKEIKWYDSPIILAHDSSEKETSYEATKTLIKHFKKKNYAFSTVDKYKGDPPLFLKMN
jgi:peptidoglycan/xylan/chitin deacetylase (PgdA/CDA1 family)